MKKIFGVSVVYAGVFLLLFSCLAMPQETSNATERIGIVLHSQDFESGIPTGWRLNEGWWIAEEDGSAVLCGNSHSFALLPDIAMLDSSLHFRIKLDPEAALHVNVRQGPGYRLGHFL